MHNIDYTYAKTVMHDREAGLRQAQRSGLAYEVKPKRRVAWLFGRRAEAAQRVAQHVPASNRGQVPAAE